MSAWMNMDVPLSECSWLPWVAMTAIVPTESWPLADNQYPVEAGQEPEQRERWASVCGLPPCSAAARAVRLGRRLAPKRPPRGLNVAHSAPHANTGAMWRAAGALSGRWIKMSEKCLSTKKT